MDDMYKKRGIKGSVSVNMSFFPFFLDKQAQRVYNSIVNQIAVNSDV